MTATEARRKLITFACIVARFHMAMGLSVERAWYRWAEVPKCHARPRTDPSGVPALMIRNRGRAK